MFRKLFVFIGITLLNVNLSAECGGIIGGYDLVSGDKYSAIVSPEGVASQITGSGASGPGKIFSSSINQNGYGIIGGYEGTNAYIALVYPGGFASSVVGEVPSGNGRIYVTAINENRNAVIGGYENGITDVYAALVNPVGAATKIAGGSPPSGAGEILGVDINSSDTSLIGGYHMTNQPYIAFVSPGGTATQVTMGDAPVGNGVIFSVSINNSDQGIVGGYDNGFIDPYLAFVDGVTATEITAGSPPVGQGQIYRVAINNSRYAIVGGQDGSSGTPYAAIITPGATAIEISGEVPTGTGQIFGVAINENNEAIIGGYEGSMDTAYAALVDSNGVATRLTGATAGSLPQGPAGYINDVAINLEGISFIVGQDGNFDSAYAALVSPEGVASRITGEIITDGTIPSVDICNFSSPTPPTPTSVVPSSIGSGNSYTNGIFSLSSLVFPSHARFAFGSSSSTPQTNNLALNKSDDLVASNRIHGKKNKKSKKVCCNQPKSTVWISPFYTNASQDNVQGFSDITNQVVGGMIGFDYNYCRNLILGFGGAYAYSDVDFSNNANKAYSNQGFLSLYGIWCANNLYANFALWGGIYRGKNERDTMGVITSKADIDGWILSPHLEVSIPTQWIELCMPICRDRFCLTLDPFIMLDWANNWQDGYTETGDAGFNLTIDDLYASTLRTEIGLRLIETLKCRCGCLRLIQKGSYVNLSSFGDTITNTFFTGAASTFSISVFSDETIHLGVFRLGAQFVPDNCNLPYFGINYQGEFGSDTMIHFVSLEIGKEF